MIDLAEKKLTSRFCIQFNESDNRHLQVMKILNSQGRHKAQYIATAILHYVNCSTNTTEIQDNAVLRQTIRSIVQEFIPPHIADVPNQSNNNDTPGPLAESLISSGDYDPDMLNLIRNSVSAFRCGDDS